VFGWTLRAVQVVAADEPVIESVLNGTTRQNDHLITGRPLHAIPTAATFYGTSAQFEERVTETGPVTVNMRTDYDDVATWSIKPANWTVGACSVRSEADGSWLPHTAPAALTRSWRIDNGMVRCWIGDPVGDPEIQQLVLWYQWWRPGGWSTAQRVRILTGQDGEDPPPFAASWGPAHVVHIGPERATVAIRGQAVESLTPWTTPLFVHLTITRGSPWVTTRVTFGDADMLPTVIVDPPSEGSWTADDGWVYETDAVDGWRTVVASTEIDPGEFPDGGSFRSLALPFGIAASHSSMTGWQTHLQLHLEWYASVGERTVVGVRS
jgi:hypothetical protein